MHLARIHHAQITINPDELDHARDFYCGVLGLEEVAKPTSLQARGGFWLTIGDQQIHVGIEDKRQLPPTKAHIAYAVDDLEAWRHHLLAHDIDIQASVPIEGFVRFEFRDPFGNRVEFIQPLP